MGRDEILAQANRESWLTRATERLWPMLVEAGAEVVPVRVSVGWASRLPSKTVGQCHHRQYSADGVCHLFISPLLSEPARVLDVLLHEMIHASDNGESGHKGYFRRTAKAVGLVGKMTATDASEELAEVLTGIAAELGTYPHDGLTLATKTKAGSRLLKGECPDCGYTVRVTKKWIDHGMPTCPCGAEMEQA